MGALLMASPAWSIATVTRCGETVQGNYKLDADLDCSEYGYDYLGFLIVNGTLHLNGHTITGKRTTDPDNKTPVIKCVYDCTIIGPGVIRQGYIGVDAWEDMTLENVELRENTTAAAITLRSLTATDVTVTGNGSGLRGIFVDVVHSTISGNVSRGVACNNGISGGKAQCNVVDSTVTDNGRGISSDNRIDMRGTVVSGSFEGVSSVRLRMDECVIQDNGDGGGIVTSGPTRIRNSQITGNTGDGVFVGGSGDHHTSKLKIADSTVTGNGDSGLRSYGRSFVVTGTDVSGNCAAGDQTYCADLSSCDALRVAGSTCGTSSNWCTDGAGFGVCSLD